MPIFEFRCPACGHQFEDLVMGRAEPSQMHCPKCKRAGVERLLSVFASGGASETARPSSGSGCGPAPSRFS
jgi:putative FmdB family regulatory protein